MQRLYSMFPQGWPGLALALLRLGVAAHLVALTLDHGRATSASLGLLLLAVFLLAGFLTPFVGAAAAVSELALAALGDSWTLSAALLMLDPILLVLLGPGAYSCDARLFGRRLLTVPD
jgi:hypothetical protein